MEFLEWFMPTVWFVILALFLLLYVILDGFDLGVGILSLTSPSESQRTILRRADSHHAFYNIYSYIVFRGKVSAE